MASSQKKSTPNIMEPRTATLTVKQEEQRNASSSRETLDEILEFNLKTASTRVTHVELELTNLLHCYSKLEAEYKQCQRELRNVEEAIEIKNADLSRVRNARVVYIFPSNANLALSRVYHIGENFKTNLKSWVTIN